MTPRKPLAATLIITVTIALTGCFSPKTDDPEPVAVDVRRAGVRITAAAEAMPVDAELTISRDDKSNPIRKIEAAGVRTLSKAAHIQIDNGEVQPSSPLTIAVDVPAPGLDDGSLVGFVLRSANGSLDYVAGRYDTSSSAVVADVPHLSWLWPVELDVGAMVSQGLTYLLEATGLQTARPACADEELVLAGRVYSLIQPSQAWVCPLGLGQSLGVEAMANSPVTFKVVADPPPSRTLPITDLGNQSTVGVALLRGLRLVESAEGVTGPGINTRFEYDEPGSVTLHFRSEPGLLLVQLLIGALEPVLGAHRIETLGKLQCFHDVVKAAQRKELDASTAAGLTGAFFSCAGELADLTPAGAVVLALVSTAPQAFAGSVLGVVEEFTGEATFEVAIEASIAITEESVQDLLIPADTCGDGSTFGWDHPDPIQLSNGFGESFDEDVNGAGVYETRLVGAVDVTGDGQQEAVVALRCTGSPRELCCAGRTSLMDFVAVLDLAGTTPRRVGNTIAPVNVPGPNGYDEPRSFQAEEVTLDGSTVVTYQTLVYPEQLTPADVSGLEGEVRYSLHGSRWVPSP